MAVILPPSLLVTPFGRTEICDSQGWQETVKMSTARDGPPISSVSSSAASAAAADGASSVSCGSQHHQQHQYGRLISAADEPEEAVPTVAEYVRSYSQLAALIDAHPTQFTAAVLLPILTRLLPVVVEAIFGGLVEVPMPQLTQGAAIIVATTRRLFILERGGNWDRWRPVLEMLYLLQGRRPVVLSGDDFGVFATRAAFVSETEAVRQWKILSRGITVTDGEQQRQLMYGNGILPLSSMSHDLPTLLTATSPPVSDAFDPADPPTKLRGLTHPSYTSMVAFVLVGWLFQRGHIPCIKSWWSDSPESASSRRVWELLAASPSDETQWAAGATVFEKPLISGGCDRLVVFGSEVMGDGHMALIKLVDREIRRDIFIYTTESGPHDHTRTVVTRVLGEQVWDMEWSWEVDDGRATANKCRCTVM
ncbi:unnamed protein product [Vitrella brassicaformis CCMP3155]|uniref:Uncharacterized protein n=1 Tax=Vitrella brassicaformis (strain CCMP3155) TaxID=1169540 RepID=A0A0G4EIP2_VITBC|nr:unnamed protein product [Vitrella brassicaformis CCMP3155]|eukprot:CEL95880.1 unnamed protein product [Vitrella brassicaformis CCMP3155]